jgi:uncharacterized protein YciI
VRQHHLANLALAVILAAAVPAQDKAQAQPNPDIPPNMRTYFMVLKVKGPNRSQPEAEAAKLQDQHIAYVRQQREAGKYMIAGPLLDDGYIRGLTIVEAANIEEVRQISLHDPAVKAGRMNVEIHPILLEDLSCMSRKKN